MGASAHPTVGSPGQCASRARGYRELASDSIGPPFARRVPASRVRTTLDRRVRLEHRHVDGDDRASASTSPTTTGQAAWTGTVAAAGVRADRAARPGRRRARRPRVPRALLLMTTTLVQTALAALLTVLVRRRRAVGTGGRHADRVRQRHRVRARVSRRSRRCSPTSCPRRTSPGAIALSSAQYNLGRVVGPALAGIVIDARRLRVGARRQRGRASSRSSPCCSTLHAPAAGAAARRRDAVGARWRSAPASCARDRGLRVERRRDVRQHVARRAVHRARSRDGREGVRRGRTRHVDPRHRAGHRRGRAWASRSAR